MSLLQLIQTLDPKYHQNPSLDGLKVAWDRCENATRMLGLVGRLDIDKTIFVQIACKCARFVLHLVPEGEDKPRLAIEAAEAWIETPSKENANAVAHAAADAASYAADAADAAADAAAAAYSASYAADAAANAADAAANAAVHATDAAAYAAYRSGDITIKKKCAEIVREYIPFELLKLAIIFN